jgi:hypothetical protein
VAEIARRARADGGCFVWWIVNPGNRAAAAFYTGLGARAEPLSAMVVHGPAFDALAGSARCEASRPRRYCDAASS